MSQRMERVAGEVRAILGETLARDEIKDPRVRGAGLITVTHVRVSGDFRQARAFFTVHGLDDAALERVRVGLDHASGLLPPGDLPAPADEGRPRRHLRGRQGVRAGRARRAAPARASSTPAVAPAAAEEADGQDARRRRPGRRRLAWSPTRSWWSTSQSARPPSRWCAESAARPASGGSATAGRSIRSPRACCRSASARRPSWRLFCSAPTRNTTSRSGSGSRPTPTIPTAR